MQSWFFPLLSLPPVQRALCFFLTYTAIVQVHYKSQSYYFPGDGIISPLPSISQDDITRSSSHSSFQVLSKSSSSGSVDGLVPSTGVLGVACVASPTSLPDKLINEPNYTIK